MRTLVIREKPSVSPIRSINYHRCEAATKGGSRCRQRATFLFGGIPLCGGHKNTAESSWEVPCYGMAGNTLVQWRYPSLLIERMEKALHLLRRVWTLVDDPVWQREYKELENEAKK